MSQPDPERREVTQVLAEVARLGIRLWTNEQSLCWRIPQGATPAGSLIESVRRRTTLPDCSSIPRRENHFLVPLSAVRRANANLVCVHPGHGTAYDYRHVAALIDSDYGIYALQAVGALIAGSPPATVEEMAAQYAEELLENGLCKQPLVLYGGCTGGFVALEIARLLAARGTPPATLAVGDTRDWSKGYAGIRASGQWVLFVEAFISYELAGTLVPRDQRFWTLNPRQRFEYMIDAVQSMPEPRYSLPLDVGVLGQHFAQYESYLQSYGRYVPREYAGRAVYVKPSIPNWGLSKRFRDNLKGTCTLHEIEGDHVALFTAAAAAPLAEVLQGELAHAAST